MALDPAFLPAGPNPDRSLDDAMTRKPSLKKYAETVGEISIQWNLLERALHVIGYFYLGGDSGVAGRIFGAMGNISKVAFITYLVDRFEKNEKLADHAHHFLKAFNILRENRNIIEHSVPSLSRDKRFLGSIAKVNRQGERALFDAPIQTLETLLGDMKTFWAYAQFLAAAILPEDRPTKEELGKDFGEAFASIDKPPLPRKLTPLLPPEDRPSD